MLYLLPVVGITIITWPPPETARSNSLTGDIERGGSRPGDLVDLTPPPDYVPPSARGLI